MNLKTKSSGWHIQCILLALVTLCLVGCKDDGQEEVAFNPNKPIIVSDFLPKEVSTGSRLMIYGDNFGNDISKVRVTIGGEKATVISVKNKSLYCFVPAKAYDGDVEISVFDNNGEEIAYAEAEERLKYVRKQVVTSFLGTMYDNNTKFDVKAGPFDDCGGFEKMEWMVFDPLNHNHLYVAGYDKSLRRIDFEKKYVEILTKNLPGNNAQVPALNFTLDGDMIMTHDQGKDTEPGNYQFTRSSGFTERITLANARGCRSAGVHPITGDYYYAFYNTGEIRKGRPGTTESEHAFMLPNKDVRVFIVIHPTGDYAYFVVNNRQYIMRADYDWDARNFKTPYLVAGKENAKDWVDGVGSNARLNEPQQGVFVKNPNYEGQAEEYDFYFCDKANQIIRILTPNGRVSTFAGTPKKSGYRDGDLRLEAEFSYPAGIAYDEDTKSFYIGDSNSHRIRKIAFEE